MRDNSAKLIFRMAKGLQLNCHSSCTGYARTRAHAHARTHARAHARTHARARARTHARTRACTHVWGLGRGGSNRSTASSATSFTKSINKSPWTRKTILDPTRFPRKKKRFPTNPIRPGRQKESVRCGSLLLGPGLERVRCVFCKRMVGNSWLGENKRNYSRTRCMCGWVRPPHARTQRAAEPAAARTVTRVPADPICVPSGCPQS